MIYIFKKNTHKTTNKHCKLWLGSTHTLVIRMRVKYPSTIASEKKNLFYTQFCFALLF